MDEVYRPRGAGAAVSYHDCVRSLVAVTLGDYRRDEPSVWRNEGLGFARVGLEDAIPAACKV
jgi:hypothetical protein